MKSGCARVSTIPILKNSRRFKAKVSGASSKKSNIHICTSVALSNYANVERIYSSKALSTEVIPVRITD